ncbi:GNAT family N-acetyltransferase [Leucobacter sp. HY1908]
MNRAPGTPIVPLARERKDALLRLESWTFPSPTPPSELLPLASPPTPWGRMWAIEASALSPAAPSPTAPDRRATPAAELAAMYGTFGLKSYPVPGAQVACGWLTGVSVHPAHRRRGLLRQMIGHHFADCLERGEAISVLNAAEAAIYGRFGYGMAAPQVSLTIARGAALRDVPGSGEAGSGGVGSEELALELHEWNAAEHGDEVARLHAGYALEPRGIGRPGWVTWETPELRAAQDEDAPALRAGAEAQRLAIVRDSAGNARAYARFRRDMSWQRNVADGTVRVRDAVALDAAAAHRLWRALLDFDLTARVEVGPLPQDDPIMSLLVDARAAAPVTDDLQWLRILDLPQALSERRYATAVDVVLEVTDELLPHNAGTWRVQAAPGEETRVTRSDAAADLALDIRELGAVHLGTVTLAQLAHAGLVRELREGALLAAATAWSWPVSAGANWVF